MFKRTLVVTIAISILGCAQAHADDLSDRFRINGYSSFEFEKQFGEIQQNVQQSDTQFGFKIPTPTNSGQKT